MAQKPGHPNTPWHTEPRLLSDGGLSTKDRRRLQEAKRKAGQSGMLKEFAQELVGAPEEVRAWAAARGAGSQGWELGWLHVLALDRLGL
jgi:hypothetical protein